MAELGLAWLTLRYPLTDPCLFDILQSGPGWWVSNAIRSIETTRVHIAPWRRGGGVAARGAGAAGGNPGDRVSQHLVSGIERTASRGIWSSLERIRPRQRPERCNRISLCTRSV